MFRMFTDRFNRASIVNAGVQGLQVTAAIAAAYGMLTNPQSSPEFVLDMATHIVTYLALQERPSFAASSASTLLNASRLGAIYTLLTTAGGLGAAVEMTDAVVHAIGLALTVGNFASPEEEVRTPTPAN
ncbi:hypothetical protein [Legionella jordanis]|uniref:Uncharacterized protein n=1 Tax=Legionella jordanis TaxID=456 RepID=A0A0W0VE67_9GAMM|nr:hypothetical protein [Legionella jordanis]KTD18410.1 hypothetical protein Ljor_2716 [Legionella jordanis]RMX05316.1 hypothetical protein EAW55_01245 [Legionella jordanis]RMX20833.1 hypothetical protein EAS68_05800 [Legionella jordanis]VEH13244.1 Uncharacterised protein [Legionella jordanis]HAT8713595.1 hypothetical protein [Legionella jordanis]